MWMAWVDDILYLSGLLYNLVEYYFPHLDEETKVWRSKEHCPKPQVMEVAKRNI